MGNYNISGSERGNIEVARTLQRAGAKVLIYTAPWGKDYLHPFLDRLGISYVVGKFGASAHHLSRNFYKLPYYWLVSTLDLLRLSKEMRPTHIHLGAELYFFELLPFILLTKAKIIFRLGDAPRKNNYLYRFMWRQVYSQKPHQIICVSKYIEDQLKPYNIDHTSVRYSYPPERRPSAHFQLPKSKNEIFITYLGLISSHKGVHLLLEAFVNLSKIYPNIKLIIAGKQNVNPAFNDQLLELIRRNGLADRVIFTGFIEDVPGLLRQSDINVVPSVFEDPLPNVVPEAKKAGVPSVVLPSGGLPEMIDHQEDGFICRDKSAEAIKEGLLFFLEQPERIPQAGKKASDSLNRLSITSQSFIDDWCKVYLS